MNIGETLVMGEGVQVTQSPPRPNPVSFFHCAMGSPSRTVDVIVHATALGSEVEFFIKFEDEGSFFLRGWRGVKYAFGGGRLFDYAIGRLHPAEIGAFAAHMKRIAEWDAWQKQRGQNGDSSSDKRIARGDQEKSA